MSLFRSGDRVSLSRAQSVLVDVSGPFLNVSSGIYSIALPINGVQRTFSVDLPLGPPSAVVEALLAVLLDQQTVYSVALDPFVPGRLVVVGPLGMDFLLVTSGPGISPGISATLFESAYVGVPVAGPLVVVIATSIVGLPPREFTTKTVPDGVVERRNVLMVRELDSGNVFEVDSRRVLTRLPAL